MVRSRRASRRSAACAGCRTDADPAKADDGAGSLDINTRPKTIVGWYTPEPGAPLPPGTDRDVNADGNECATLNFGRHTDVPAVIDAVSHVLTLARSPRISSVESRLKGTPFAAVPDASHLKMPSMAR